MATFTKRGKSWRVRVMVHGKQESSTHKTKQEAAQWALQREAEAKGNRLPDKTLDAALERYGEEISPTKEGKRWELLRLAAMRRHPIARRPVAKITPDELDAWKRERLEKVSAGTVAREMNLLRSVLRHCVKPWGWAHDNPLADVKPPKSPPSRKRRIPQDEIERVTLALGISDGNEAATAENRTGQAFLFALETAMRSGEILRLTWADVHPTHVHVRKSKNGDERDVPLSPRAREILDALPRDAATCFNVKDGTRDALFRRAVDDAQIDDLHFHDSRAEAIWRLSKRLDIYELARAIGHRNLNSLLLYYRTDMATLADKLK